MATSQTRAATQAKRISPTMITRSLLRDATHHLFAHARKFTVRAVVESVDERVVDVIVAGMRVSPDVPVRQAAARSSATRVVSTFARTATLFVRLNSITSMVEFSVATFAQSVRLPGSRPSRTIRPASLSSFVSTAVKFVQRSFSN